MPLGFAMMMIAKVTEVLVLAIQPVSPSAGFGESIKIDICCKQLRILRN